MSGDPELANELIELAASVRALAEWHASTGSSGLLTESSPEQALASLGISGSPPARGGSRPSSASAPQTSRHEMRPAFQAAPPAPPPEDIRPARVAPQPAPSPLAMASMPAGADIQPPAPKPRLEPIAPVAYAPPTAPILLAADNARAAILTPVTGSETPEERRVKLAMIAEEVRACVRCGLHAQRKQTVFARGNPASELCFIGEGPGADEDEQGLPFVGKAGQLLDKMIAAMGYGRDDVYICNIVKCRPPENRKPEPDEMAACTPYVTAQLALVKPKVIVALGATAVEGLLGIGGGITRMRGKWKLYKGMIPVMPTFHPAYLLRQPAAKREVWEDLKAVLQHLGKTAPQGR